MPSLAKLISGLEQGSKEAIPIAKDTIDKAANAVHQELQRTTPNVTGGLVGSLRIEPIVSASKYGKVIDYDGYDKQGQAYSAIANSLNHGRMSYKGQKRKRSRKNHSNAKGARLFIDNAQSQLKGLDNKISQNIIDNINNKTRV